MCLIADKNLPIQTASEDMCVYKVFETVNNELHSPYCGYSKYELGAESTTELDEMNPYFVQLVTHFYVSGRGFYSFTNSKSAMDLVKDLRLRCGSCNIYECLECTVPNGARYITDGNTVISDRIIPKDISPKTE